MAAGEKRGQAGGPRSAIERRTAHAAFSAACPAHLATFSTAGHTAIFGKADPGLVDCLDYLPWDGTGVPNVMANQPPA